MKRCEGRWLMGVGLVWLGTMPGLAKAQAPIGSVGTPAGGSALSLANPYTNPYMNPFLNPYATMNPAGRNGTMLYFLAARQQQQAELAAAQAQAAAAPSASRAPAGVPAGAASRYFQRTIPVSSRATAYYQRYDPYYSGIRR